MDLLTQPFQTWAGVAIRKQYDQQSFSIHELIHFREWTFNRRCDW